MSKDPDHRLTYSGREFSKLLTDIGQEKARKAQSRMRPRLPGLEEPRTVFLDACSRVCAEYADRGFVYAKSGPHMTRRDGDLSFEVRFQSDPNNIAGEFVVLIGHANVRSARLRKWQRKDDAFRRNGYIAGGQLGALQADQRWIQWNLADPTSRDHAIADIIAHIERFAIPLFDLCSNLPKLFDDYAQGRVALVGMDAAILVEVANVLVSRDAAMEVGRRAFTDLTPEGQSNYAIRLGNLRGTSPDVQLRTAWGCDLARVAFVHSLDFSN